MNEVAARGARKRRLDVLAVAPLPFSSNGAAAFLHGASVFYAELLPRLARAGHGVRVIAEAPKARRGESRSGLAWHVPNLAVDWFAFDYRSGTRAPTRAFRRALDRDLRPVFLRRLRQRRPDVVLIGREVLAPYVHDLCRRHGLPCVLVAHGVALAALIDGTYPPSERRPMVAALRAIDAIVAVARHLEEDLRSLGVTRVRTIPNVVDTTTFRPSARSTQLLSELCIPPDATIVGHFSRLRPVKRPLDVVQSAARVLRSLPDTIYLIVGHGPSKAPMEKLARGLGVADHFRFVGEVDRARVPALMNLCDVVVMPSERESFPLVYREVQACGGVILASDIPAAREAIVPRRTGMLFRAGSIGALADATRSLLGAPRLRASIGKRARAAARAESPARWRAAYAEVLRRASLAPRPTLMSGVDSPRLLP